MMTHLAAQAYRLRDAAGAAAYEAARLQLERELRAMALQLTRRQVCAARARVDATCALTLHADSSDGIVRTRAATNDFS